MIWTFVGKVMSLHFNMLSRFVIAFLPRSKHLFLVLVLEGLVGLLEPAMKFNDACSLEEKL